MRLIEIFEEAVEQGDDDTTFYVEWPWAPDAEAILVSPSPDTTEPVERDGRSYDYFLEVFIAREVIEDFAATEGESASRLRRCKRLILYAETDA